MLRGAFASVRAVGSLAICEAMAKWVKKMPPLGTTGFVLFFLLHPFTVSGFLGYPVFLTSHFSKHQHLRSFFL